MPSPLAAGHFDAPELFDTDIRPFELMQLAEALRDALAREGAEHAVQARGHD